MRAITVAAAALTGCSLLTDLDGLAGVSQPDASLVDASIADTASGFDGALADGSPAEGGTPDARTDAPADVSAIEAATFKIACRGLTCTAPNCCIGSDASCKPACAIFEITVACDDKADCPGDSKRCCAQTSGGAMLSSSCTTGCSSPNVVLCDPAAPNLCEGATTCQGATGLIPYPHCR